MDIRSPVIPDVTGRLADYVCAIDGKALPAPVRDAVKLLLLDNVGCAIAGARTKPAIAFRNCLAQFASDGSRGSTVLGHGRLAPAPAAGANAYAASVLSFDDSIVRLGHPGTATIPAALAAAEAMDCDGRDLIAALVAGYEVMLRIGEAIRPSPASAQQVQGLATWQIFGAASALGRLYGFEPAQVANLFGITAQMAPVPFLGKFYDGPKAWLKNNYGWSAIGAVLAADLNAGGFVGNRDIFDGDNGFWAMAGSDRQDANAMTAGLGEDYRLLQVGFKPYGCCRWVHSALDIVRDLRSQNAGKEPTCIEIETISAVVEDFAGPLPQSIFDAQFHLPYLVALEMHGKSSAFGLRDEDLEDGVLHDCASRVSLSVLAGADEKFLGQSLLPARLTLSFADGESVSAYAEVPKGAPGGPQFGSFEIIDKFMHLCEPSIGKGAAGRLRDAILDIEERPVAKVLADAIAV
ncbi:MmgE/PrpD family protein [Neorhizobium alkalisoli]|jgi:2-methylcitrate dehydratase PrpD|uniref:2-methylcitrate dehydratase PrpD n=1 Tax=Neorhizobium alkalisoli TaxID=528178 RepID=A0A561PZ89_9HYPH|nr:MmgE/PrpD family protein [Neorhizobium alkalisoli]TWF43437.1 2-methylcitrate dehydratase PrpD [Neorhizobium alkalisoli]